MTPSSIPLPLPMLAHPYESRKATFPCLAQPKLDGVRMLAAAASEVALRSRTGKSFDHLLPLFAADVASALSRPKHRRLVLDGELYAHGIGFQRIVSMAKNSDLVATDAAAHLAYHVYDVIVPDAPSMAYADRRALLREAFGSRDSLGRLRLVPDVVVATEAGVQPMLRRMMAAGYEGVVLRDPASAYAAGGRRSSGLLKLKTFMDAEFEIVRVEEARGKDAGTALFVCSSAGKEFRVRPEGTRQARAAMLRDAQTLIGRRLTVRYQDLTDGGVPRFPIGVAVRDYE